LIVRKAVLFTAIVAFFVIVGCSRSPNSASVSDEDAIFSLITEQNATTTGSVFRGDTLFVGGDSPLATPIDPFGFYRDGERTLRTVTVTFDFNAQPPTAVAEVEWGFTGTFNIVTASGTISKPLEDTGTRYLWLERRGSESDRHRGWELVGVSCLEIVSETCTRTISSIRVQASGVDTTLYSPSAEFDREGIITFDEYETVTITATTGDSTDMVLLHYRFGREPLVHVGEGVFVGSWVVQPWDESFGVHERRCRHVAIDVLHHDTVFDDEYIYDSNAWALPYDLDD
jgi:hypothetical protein